MSRRQALLLAIVALLAVAMAMLAARVVDRQRAPRLELGSAQRAAMAEAAASVLRGLGDPVVATFLVTPASEMPTSMKHVEREVADALDALARSSGGMLSWDVLHPGADETIEKLATRYGARPFPVRTILRDGHSEQSVHSSLILAAGPRPAVTINGITLEQAVRLPGLVAAHLERIREPRPARIALAAPAGYQDLQRRLASFGSVTTVDLDAPGTAIPADADVLIWLQPHSMDASRVRELELFLERGRSAIIAGSRRWVTPTVDGRRGEVVPIPYGLDPLLDAFGLRAVDGLVLDPPRAEVRTPLPTGVAPMHIRNIGQDQDFRLMSEHLSASLLFAAPTPIALAEAGASRDGWSFETLASTSDGGVLAPWPTGVMESIDVARITANASPLPRAPLIALLRPHDPWSGSLVFLSSTLPLADGMLDRDGFGHRKLVDILLATLGGPERLVAVDAWTAPTAPVPELSAAARIRWRLICILPIPLLLMAIGAWRHRSRRLPSSHGAEVAGAGSPKSSRRLRKVPARPGRARDLLPLGGAALALVAIAVVTAIGSAGAGRVGVRADLTSAGSNSVAPQTLEIARGAPPISAELIATERLRLPPRLRAPAAALESLLADVAARTPDLQVRVVRPESLDAATRSTLREEGVEESTFTDRDEEITVVRRFTCELRLRSADGRTETLLFPDESSFEHAEFRLAFALWRMTRDRTVTVAVISDRPRPTPAEAHEFFQLQGLQPPMGTDVYSLARQTLERHDFRVLTLDHREPTVPDDADLLLWLQPRRPGAMLAEVLSRFLHAGRPAIVAAQQFNIQARLYPGRDHRVVYWPQPQWPDMQGGWFGSIGATIPRLIVLDELQMSSRAESQVMGRNQRRFDEHETSLPFLLRAAAGNFDRDVAMMRGLGDQGFVWGSAIGLDPVALARRGIVATPLITTSPRTWTYAWEGGFLPAPLLDGPLTPARSDDDGAGTTADLSGREEGPWSGRLPLAVLLEGRFPLVGPEETDWIDQASLPLAVPSRLLLVGGSELFKNNRLRDPAYRGDHFLLNAVAEMAGDPRLVEIITRRTVPRGLDYVDPTTRFRWRAVVVLAPTAALLVLATAVATMRRLPSRVRTGRGADAVEDIE